MAALLAMCAACTGAPDSSRGVAEAFLDAHYVEIDLDVSRDLCTGLARYKVDKEIELTRDVEIGEDTRKPRVNYRLEDAREKAGHAQYAYELTIRAPGLEPFSRLVMVTVRDTDGSWTVTNYSDGEFNR